MLEVRMYSSTSGCFHGRPKRLNGSWYTTTVKCLCALLSQRGMGGYESSRFTSTLCGPTALVWGPTRWEAARDRLEMLGTAMREPDCKHEWCRLKDSIKWSGPGENGYCIDPRSYIRSRAVARRVVGINTISLVCCFVLVSNQVFIPILTCFFFLLVVEPVHTELRR